MRLFAPLLYIRHLSDHEVDRNAVKNNSVPNESKTVAGNHLFLNHRLPHTDTLKQGDTMPVQIDYKTLFENLPLPAAIFTPLYNNEKALTDIHVDAVNKQFLALTKKTIQKDCLFSTIKDSLTPDIDWLAFAAQSLHESSEKNFYSIVAKTYLKITASALGDGSVAICMTNIAKEKETEQQLRRQNARLEELTAQL